MATFVMIDDDPFIYNSVVPAMSRRRHTAHHFRSPAAAWRFLQEQRNRENLFILFGVEDDLSLEDVQAQHEIARLLKARSIRFGWFIENPNEVAPEGLEGVFSCHFGHPAKFAQLYSELERALPHSFDGLGSGKLSITPLINDDAERRASEY